MLEIVSFYYPLFMPEEFHTGNYTKITQQCGCLFYKQKSPREEAECLVIAKIQNNR